jgi:hypothetical protein
MALVITCRQDRTLRFTSSLVARERGCDEGSRIQVSRRRAEHQSSAEAETFGILQQRHTFVDGKRVGPPIETAS